MSVSIVRRPLLKRISILDAVNLLFLGMNILFYLIAFMRTPYQARLFVLYALLFLFILFMGWIRERFRQGRLTKLVLFVYPVIFLFGIFETFYMLLPFFNSLRLDAVMANIDHALLGVNPTVWIEQWAQPLLTDVLYLFYFFYFPMPLIMLGWMYANGKLQEAEESFFLYLFCYYGAYIMYFFIPVEGPRFYLNGLQNVPLDGVVLSEPIRRLIDTLEPNKLDAFPSLHAAILTMTMLLTYRHNRKLFHAFIPCAIGITVSLVYLRYHYVIDVIVGFVWAIMSYQFAGKVYRSVRPALTPHFRSVEP
jgi:membrane-associated phospholipid phosphatase